MYDSVYDAGYRDTDTLLGSLNGKLRIPRLNVLEWVLRPLCFRDVICQKN